MSPSRTTIPRVPSLWLKTNIARHVSDPAGKPARLEEIADHVIHNFDGENRYF